MLATRLKQWEREFEERGIEKGREEGLIEGKASMLRKALMLKFGTTPEWTEQNIASADIGLIEQWFTNLLVVDNIEDVFN